MLSVDDFICMHDDSEMGSEGQVVASDAKACNYAVPKLLRTPRC